MKISNLGHVAQLNQNDRISPQYRSEGSIRDGMAPQEITDHQCQPDDLSMLPTPMTSFSTRTLTFNYQVEGAAEVLLQEAA